VPGWSSHPEPGRIQSLTNRCPTRPRIELTSVPRSGLCPQPGWVWPQRAGREALTGPSVNWSRLLPGPGTLQRPWASSAAGSDEVTEPAEAVSARTPQTCRSARRRRHSGTAAQPCSLLLRHRLELLNCRAHYGRGTRTVRTRAPRQAGPRPCLRSCSQRGRARSPGSGGPWRASSSPLRRAHVHARAATGRGRPRPP
jgi:hypothetical protein